jgi:SPP1 gp7 family putative phage head morphogenesis protein
MRSATVSDLQQVLVPRRLPSSENMGRRYYGRGLNLTQIEAALRNAESGLMADITDLENESVSLYPHACGVLVKRFGSVAALDYSLVPAHGPRIDKVLAKDLAEEVQGQLDAYEGLRFGLYQTAWGIFHGRSAHEIYWRLLGGMQRRWELEGLSWIHPRRISFGDERQLQLIDTWHQASSFSSSGMSLRDYPGKFTSLVASLFADYPEKEGLGPRTLYWSFFQRSSWRWRMALTELFANGWRVLEQSDESNCDPDAVDDAFTAAESLGENSTLALPKGMTLKTHWPGGDAGATDLYTMTPKDVDEQISKLVLGQTGTTDGTENRANSITAKGEQDIFLALDARMVEGSWQSGIVRPIVELNRGYDALSHAPRFRLHSEQGRDTDKELKRLETILQWGMPVAEGEVRELVGYRRPDPDEPYVVLGQSGGVNAMGQPMPAQMKVVDPSKLEPPPETPPDPGQPPEDPGALEDGGNDLAAANAVKDLLAADGGAARRPLTGSATEATPESTPVQLAKQNEAGLLDEAIGPGARAMTSLVSSLLGALEGAPSVPMAPGILREWARKADSLALASALYEAMLRAAMLGASDSQIEIATGEPVSIGELDADRGPIRWLLDEPRGYTEGKTDENGWLKQGKLRIKSFDEAIQEFMGRGAVSRSVFDQMARAAKSNAFTAAKLATEQARKVAQDAIGEVMQSGGSLRDFGKILRTNVETSGLTSSYVENVYRTNVAGAYSKGRVAHMTQPAVLKAFPYWQVVTVNDGAPRQRPTHQHVHGWCMRADDAGWQTSGIPPWGFQCRCRVVARSAKWVEKNSPTIWSGALPGLPDEGFESHPPPTVAAQEVEVAPAAAQAQTATPAPAPPVAEGPMPVVSRPIARAPVPAALPPQPPPLANADARHAYARQQLRSLPRFDYGEGGAGDLDAIANPIPSFTANLNGYAEPPWPSARQERIDELSAKLRDLEKRGEAPLPRQVSIRELRSMTPDLMRANVRTAIDEAFKGAAGDVPIVVRSRGKLYVYENVEQVAALRLGERKTAQVHLIDLDAKQAWKPRPKKPTPVAGSHGPVHLDFTTPDAFAKRLEGGYRPRCPGSAVRHVFGSESVPTIESFERVWGSETHKIVINSASGYVQGKEGIVQVAGKILHEGKEVGNVTRTFKRHANGEFEVHHDFFKIEGTGQLGKGTGEAMLRQSIKCYEQLGVNKITVDAAWVGRYTWASFGYNWDWYGAKTIEGNLTKYLTWKGIAPQRAADIAKKVSPVAWQVAGLDVDGITTTFKSEDKTITAKVGKSFLLEYDSAHGAGHMWSGTLQIDDKTHPTYLRAKERLGL